jgi:hypothetical protein
MLKRSVRYTEDRRNQKDGSSYGRDERVNERIRKTFQWLEDMYSQVRESW